MPRKSTASAGSPVDQFFRAMERTDTDCLAGAVTGSDAAKMERQRGLIKSWIVTATKELLPDRHPAFDTLQERLFDRQQWESAVGKIDRIDDRSLSAIVKTLHQNHAMSVGKILADIERDFEKSLLSRRESWKEQCND